MNKATVLIAEDMDILRENYREIVDNDPGFHVVATAASGAEALRLYRENPVDLVLMDIEMEDATSGIRATEAITADDPKARIIYLTAHETEQTILTAMASGAADYLVKGCGKAHMLEHMRQVLQGAPMLDSKIQEIVMNEYKRLHRSEKSLFYFITKIGSLTPTERELVRYLLDGYKLREIAETRHVEIVTVKTQIHTLLGKFGCKHSSEVVKLITDLGITQLF